ncbi:MAG: cytochrome b/b6 domain-containing protein [Geminicoccaceae bacterium]
MTNEESNRTVKVWDLPVRLFHWLLAALFVTSWLSVELGEMDRHLLSGYAILTLILFRLIWGLFGSTTAKLHDCVHSPRRIAGYLGDLLKGRPPQWVGHNPVGGLAVLALLILVALQVGTGLFANDDIFTEGPLASQVSKETSDWLTTVHKTSFNVLLAFVAIHIAANLLYLVGFRQNLIGAMITGRKSVQGEGRQLRFPSPLWAVVALGVSAGAVWWIVN